MSYRVLARKWRPRTFSEMVGQEHVLRALVNALDHDRLHHAYLFTGTRGVGKTSIARILAKSLNCEQGISSRPCGECAACREIDEGRFVDLIEVDAASRTKVEDTRDLLDNVQYAPTRGRFKVYLIDEVHMLSKSSFNALLKTLEEPPPHVKFLLATTEPQRLPATILSRCLQFNLKRLPPELIARQLARILEEEGIAGDAKALVLIARAADGSLRDALSLLDQAIAFGGGAAAEADVRAMLGSIDAGYVIDLLRALAARDGTALLECVQRAAERGFDFQELLAGLLSALHRVALAQLVPDALPEGEPDREALLELAARLEREDVQLYYQIGLLGRRDLELAPDLRGGFEMVLLRMLAFRPAEAAGEGAAERAAAGEQGAAAPGAHAAAAPGSGSDEWGGVVAALKVSGIVRELAGNCTLAGRDADTIRLVLDAAHRHLRNPRVEERLQEALESHYGRALRLEIVAGTPAGETPARRRHRREQDRQQQAVAAIEGDQGLQALKETFNARVIPDTIQPVD